MLKYQQVVDVLSQRIDNGEYPDGQLPALRQLAEDIGVSYMTARKAIKTLKQRGMISRNESNRKTLIDTHRAKLPRVCMITPLWNFTDWHRLVREATCERGGHVHFVTYSSDTDPVITEALGLDFDVFFVALPVNRKNARLLERLRKLGKKAVVLFNDMRDHGVRSLLGPNPVSVQAIMQTLYDRGCRRIDVIGSGDRHSRDLELRLQSWQDFKDRRGIKGEGFFPVVKSFERVEVEVYRQGKKWLGDGTGFDAIYCLTPPVALGVYRICGDLGLRVGRDVSLFTFGDATFCDIMTPRLATIDATGRIKPLVDELIDQYCPGREPDDRLVFQAEEYGVCFGESLKPET